MTFVCSCEKRCRSREEMRFVHGTPDVFAEAVENAVNGLMVTPLEASAAIRKYREEYAAAPETVS